MNGKVVGVTFVSTYPNNLFEIQKKLLESPLEWIPAAIRRNPNNEYDRNACEVLCNGRMIGHLPKETAAIVAPLLDAGRGYDFHITHVGVSPDQPDKPGANFQLEITGFKEDKGPVMAYEDNVLTWEALAESERFTR